MNRERDILSHYVRQTQNLHVGRAHIEQFAVDQAGIALQNLQEGARRVGDVHDRAPLPAAAEYEDLALLHGIQGHQVDDEIEAHPARQAEYRCLAQYGN